MKLCIESSELKFRRSLALEWFLIEFTECVDVCLGETT